MVYGLGFQVFVAFQVFVVFQVLGGLGAEGLGVT